MHSFIFIYDINIYITSHHVIQNIHYLGQKPKIAILKKMLFETLYPNFVLPQSSIIATVLFYYQRIHVNNYANTHECIVCIGTIYRRVNRREYLISAHIISDAIKLYLMLIFVKIRLQMYNPLAILYFINSIKYINNRIYKLTFIKD